MKWSLSFILLLIGCNGWALPLSQLLKQWDLGHQISFSANEQQPLDLLFISTDLSKVVILSSNPQFGKEVDAGNLVSLGRWKFYRSKDQARAVFFKGVSAEQIPILMQNLEKSSSFSRLQILLGESALAEVCEGAKESRQEIARAGQAMAGKISLTRAVENCDMNLLEMIKSSVSSALSMLTDWSLPSLSKLGEMMDTLQYALTHLSTDIIKNLGPLVEKAPQFVEGFLCQIFKDQVPGLAMSIVMPGGMRRLPVEVMKILERVEKFVRAPGILKLVENLALKASPRQLEQFMPILTKLSHVNPETMKGLKFQQANLEVHYKKHLNEFSGVANVTDYQKKAEEFSKASNSKIINYCQADGVCSKLDLSSGEYLVASDKGNFISFYKLNGANSEERFANFLAHQKNHGEFVQ